MWYRKHIGGERCPIVDTWWQTETGTIMIAPVPGATSTKPGSATRPLPGIIADVVDRAGQVGGANEGGLPCYKTPVAGDDAHNLRRSRTFQQAVLERYRRRVLHRRRRRRDEDGYFWIMGRIDDVINVSGHRIGTMEVESALVSHPR